jgi:hypothetical protein
MDYLYGPCTFWLHPENYDYRIPLLILSEDLEYLLKHRERYARLSHLEVIVMNPDS